MILGVDDAKVTIKDEQAWLKVLVFGVPKTVCICVMGAQTGPPSSTTRLMVHVTASERIQFLLLFRRATHRSCL